MNREYRGARTRAGTRAGTHIWALSWAAGFLGLILAPAFPALTHSAWAESERIPRFVSLQSGQVNMRIGPGEDYPIQWIYQRAGLPVEVIEEFDVWRRVRDHDGIIGWVRANLLSGKRTLLVRDRRRALLSGPEDQAQVVAFVEPGVILSVLECEKIWCRVKIRDFKGWLRKDEAWGIYADETIGN